MFCPLTLFQVVRFEKFLHKWGGMFFQDDHFEYHQPYVIFKIAGFVAYICLFQYLLALYLHKPYFFNVQVQFW